MSCWDLYDLEPCGFEVSRDSSDDLHKQIERIRDSISDTMFMTRLRQTAWDTVSSKCLTSTDEMLEDTINKALNDIGLRNVISAVTVRLFEQGPVLEGESDTAGRRGRAQRCRISDEEKLPYIRVARVAWERGINEELAAISAEKRRPFIATMPEDTEEHPLLSEHMSAAKRQDVRFLFDSDDLLDTITKIVSPNEAHCERHLGVVKFPLSTPTIRQLSGRYKELGRTEMQIGLDDEGGQYGVKFYLSRHNEAAKVVAHGNVLDARQYLRKGCPPSLRSNMWRLALCLPPKVSKKEELHYRNLTQLCTDIDVITDDLFVMDVNSFCDDTSFFVFEENLREITLCFSRDETVSRDCQYQVHKPLLSNHTVSHPLLSASAPIPPCGIQPFLGFSAYMSPFSYVFRDKAACYSTARAMFCRLWCRVNVISGDEGCLPHLCATFEDLLLQSDMRLYLHLVKLGVQPLHIAFPWMQLGFVGFLDVEQVLILWDRLLGYMDVTILACLAAAVFIYRSQSLCECEDVAAVHSIMAIGNCLKVVPLLQFFLMSEKS